MGSNSTLALKAATGHCWLGGGCGGAGDGVKGVSVEDVVQQRLRRRATTPAASVSASAAVAGISVQQVLLDFNFVFVRRWFFCFRRNRRTRNAISSSTPPNRST